YEDLAVSLTDRDGDNTTDTLSVQIVDDVPDALNDTDAVSNATNTATGNVINGNNTTNDPAGDDILGADGAAVSGVSGVTTDTSPDGSGNFQVNGTYGSLTINQNGTYTYTRSGSGALTATDTFTYTLKDGDTDTDTATLVVSINDGGVTIDNLTPQANGGDATVDEKGLPVRGAEPEGTGEAAAAGANGDTSEQTTGTFTISASDGLASLQIGSSTFTLAQLTGATSGSPLVVTGGPTYGALEITGYSAGTVTYRYTLTDNTTTHTDIINGGDGDSNRGTADQVFANYSVVATDADGDASAPATLSIAVNDDAPIALNDTDVVQSVVKDFNVAFVLDFSGSISNTELNTMLLAVKAAALEIFNNPLADDVTMKIVAFSNDSTAYPGSGSFTSYATFAAQIDALNPTAGGTRPYSSTTDFTDAIQETMASFVPVPTASNQVFFISDGNPNEQTGTGGNSLSDATAANWNTFVDNNDINVSTVGVGDGIISARLQDVDLDGAGTPVLVDNFDDLINALLSIINAPVATGNVITGADTTTGVAGADTPGADGAKISGVSGTGGSDTTPTSGNFEVNGTHGTLSINENGSYTYTRSGTAPLVASDIFTYTLKDGDGDTTTATLTINIADNGVSITKPAQVNGADVVVDEDDLLASRGANEAAGSDLVKESTTQAGTFTVTAPDGVGNLTVGGLAVVVDGVYQGNGINTTTPLGNTLTITSFIAGVVTYTYTLNDNETHPNANGENFITEDLTVNLTDSDGDSTSSTLTVKIIDDVPLINSITNLVAQNNAGTYIGNWLTTGADGFNANVSGTNTNSAEGINLTLTNLASITLIKASGTEDKFDGSGNYLGEMYTAYLDVAKTQTFFTLFMKTNGTYEFNLVQPNPPVTTTETIDVKASIGGLSGDLYLEQITEAKGLADPVTDIRFTSHYGFVSNTNLGTVSNVNTSANGLGVSTSGDGGGGIFIKENESMTLTFFAGDADTDGDTHPSTAFAVDSVAIGFDTQTTGSGSSANAEVRFIRHYTDGTSDFFDDNTVTDEVVTVTAAAGKKISSIDVVNRDDDGETFLITSTATTITKTALPADLNLNFNVQVVDGDGDVSSTVPFSVTIDTNNDIHGSAGNDILYGETGVKDTFSWNLGDVGVDTVMNFSNASASGVGTGDVLNLKDLLVGETHTGTLPGTLGTYLDFSLNGGNTVIDVRATGGAVTQTIVLQGVDLVTGNTESQIITNLLTNNKLITD
ncbi:MAG: type I secretion C-terminal target domain-containing protein, partial [Burkholderiales bacterium]